MCQSQLKITSKVKNEHIYEFWLHLQFIFKVNYFSEIYNLIGLLVQWNIFRTWHPRGRCGVCGCSSSQCYNLHSTHWISVSVSVKSSCRSRLSLIFLLALRVTVLSLQKPARSILQLMKNRSPQAATIAHWGRLVTKLSSILKRFQVGCLESES